MTALTVSLECFFIIHNDEVLSGMTFTFDILEWAALTRKFPELRGMRSTFLISNVYSCDGMGGIILTETNQRIKTLL